MSGQRHYNVMFLLVLDTIRLFFFFKSNLTNGLAPIGYVKLFVTYIFLSYLILHFFPFLCSMFG